MSNIEIGSFVKVIKKRPYDFMDTIYLQVLKVYDIYENNKGETVLELMADDYLIKQDRHLRLKGVIGFLIDEVELSSESDVILGRILNLSYQQDNKKSYIKSLQYDVKDLEKQKEKVLLEPEPFTRTIEHKTWIEELEVIS